MIFGSLLLIFAAIALAVLGVAQDSNGLLIGSIVASLLAAVALVVGARQSTAGVPDEPRPVPELVPVGAVAPTGTVPAAAQRLPGSAGTVFASNNSVGLDPGGDPGAAPPIPSQAPPADAAAPTGARTSGAPPDGAAPPGVSPVGVEPTPAGLPFSAAADAFPAGDDSDDPPDEPPVEPATAAERARVALLHSEVLVLDGRPRYHLADCAHLTGHDDSEPLPVSEAEELGFTPCSACAPLHTLLAR